MCEGRCESGARAVREGLTEAELQRSMLSVYRRKTIQAALTVLSIAPFCRNELGRPILIMQREIASRDQS